MRIKWFGHACFLMTSSNGTRVLMDPFDASVGYKAPKTEADVVTTSHKHFDHYNLEAAEGEYVHLDAPGRFEVKDIGITGISTLHDKEGGKKRGNNVVYVFDIDGLRVCHLGDLGHILQDEQLKEIGQIDILLLPVGGTYTIDYKEATELVGLMNPRLVIPMHYKTPVLDFPIDGVDKFLANIGSFESANQQEIEIQPESFHPTARVLLLNYE